MDLITLHNHYKYYVVQNIESLMSHYFHGNSNLASSETLKHEISQNHFNYWILFCLLEKVRINLIEFVLQFSSFFIQQFWFEFPFYFILDFLLEILMMSIIWEKKIQLKFILDLWLKNFPKDFSNSNFPPKNSHHFMNTEYSAKIDSISK
jgi:hypothetical protein